VLELRLTNESETLRAYNRQERRVEHLGRARFTLSFNRVHSSVNSSVWPSSAFTFHIRNMIHPQSGRLRCTVRWDCYDHLPCISLYIISLMYCRVSLKSKTLVQLLKAQNLTTIYKICDVLYIFSFTLSLLYCQRLLVASEKYLRDSPII